MLTLGIRRETKSPFERRVPLTPLAVARLANEHGVQVAVERSDIRVYPDHEWFDAGAQVVDDCFESDLVIAVKEIPERHFRPGGAYLFFSHTIKGQAYNMPMLRRLMELGCTLFDYEKVTDEDGRRLIYFSWFAGAAGLVDTMWTYGRRAAAQGHTHPFSTVRRTWEYGDLNAVEEAMEALSFRIARDGFPKPMVIGIAGYGNVSKGAQHTLAYLPVLEVSPEELPQVAIDGPRDRVIKVVFREEHMVAPKAAGAAFDLQEYFQHPERYRSIFEQHVPYLDLLINGIYWTEAYPRLITLDQLKTWVQQPQGMRLQVVGDISCDPHGSVQSLVRTTTPGEPSYVYDPLTGQTTSDLDAPGIAMMGVDILPSELPRESSENFCRTLMPFLPDVLKGRLDVPFDDLDLPGPMKRAMILHRGQLTPDFQYLQSHLQSHPSEPT